ncbi:MAG: GDSL-type esterase/lipase family protein [Bacteroidia bacterium]|nr:GDSL-type esterase/lipase family protein [Bacteroidia bacterium]
MKKNNLTYWSILLILIKWGYAQPYYPFIRHEENKILGKDMGGWRKDLEELKKGERKTLTLLHFGGSHVQAGVWSHVFFSNLISEEKLSVKGYIFFPYSTMKSNHPVYVNTYSNGRWKKCRSIIKDFCEPLGPMGVSAYTADSVAILQMALNKKESLMKNFKVLYLRHHLHGNTKIVCTYPDHAKVKYDSLSARISFQESADSVEIKIINPDSFSVYRVFYAQFLNPDTDGVIFGAMGANGASSESMLRVKHLSRFMEELKPDWLIVSYGVNDVQGKNYNPEDFYRHYDTLLARLNSKGSSKVLMMGITDNYIRKKGHNRRTLSGSNVLKKLSADRHYWYWPLFDVMGGPKSIQKWYKAGLAKRDRIHLNSKGYQLLAHLMTEAFFRKLNENRP